MTGQLRVNWNRQIQSHAGWAMSLLVLAFGGGTLTLALVAAWAGVRLNDACRSSADTGAVETARMVRSPWPNR